MQDCCQEFCEKLKKLTTLIGFKIDSKYSVNAVEYSNMIFVLMFSDAAIMQLNLNF